MPCFGLGLSATGAEVIAVAVDVGQGGEDLETIRQRALDCGAVEAYVADARQEFVTDYCMPALKANALYMDAYPPGFSSLTPRYHQAPSSCRQTVWCHHSRPRMRW